MILPPAPTNCNMVAPQAGIWNAPASAHYPAAAIPAPDNSPRAILAADARACYRLFAAAASTPAFYQDERTAGPCTQAIPTWRKSRHCLEEVELPTVMLKPNMPSEEATKVNSTC